MPEPTSFSLHFIRSEQHMMLPTVTSIKLTQNLYNALFQYVYTEEREKLLKKLIEMLESHIKSKASTPFSRPLAELEFLDEGLEELKLLNWHQITVSVFEISLPDGQPLDEERLEEVLTQLEGLMMFSRPAGSNTLWVYPYTLVR